MSSDTIRKKALELSRKAVEEDLKGNYERSFSLYKQAIKQIFLMQKCKP